MDARRDGFFQTGVLGTPPDAISITERFDLVIGSGRKGQTYLYWKEDQLFQLPVSYWTEVGSWVNSPGYGDRTLDFSRPVVPRCLECHASFFEPTVRIRKSLSPAGLRARRLVRTLSWSRRKTRGAKRAGKAQTHGASDRESGETAARTSTRVVFVVSWRNRRGQSACVLFHGWQCAGRLPQVGNAERE